MVAVVLWQGPNMLAIMINWGPYMLAISIKKNLICLLKSKMDHICLQSFSIGTKYANNVGNRP